MRIDNKLRRLIQEHRELGEGSILFRYARTAIARKHKPNDNWLKTSQIMGFLADMALVFEQTTGKVTPEDLIHATYYLGHVRRLQPLTEYAPGLDDVYSQIRGHAIANPGWSREEESLEMLIYQSETEGPDAQLSAFVGDTVRVLQSFKRRSQTEADVGLDGLLKDLDSMKKEAPPSLMLATEFIRYKAHLLVDETVYARIDYRIIMDELYVLAYELGMIPITTNTGEKVRVGKRQNIELLTIKPTTKTSKRQERDTRLNRLQMRIGQRASRSLAPHWWDIVYQTSMFGRVKAFHEQDLQRVRFSHNQGMEPALLIGEEYLTGKKVLWAGEKDSKQR